MKKLLTLLLTSILTACSSVNSVQPFDQEQAAKLLQQHFTPKPAQKVISYSLPKPTNWQRIDRSLLGLNAPIMLIPINENAHHWSESISSEIYSRAHYPDMNASTAIAAQIADIKSHCDNVHDTILAQNAESAVAELSISNCYQAKNRTEIIKAFNAKDAVYLIRYTAIFGEVNQQAFNTMKTVVTQSVLMENPKHLPKE